MGRHRLGLNRVASVFLPALALAAVGASGFFVGQSLFPKPIDRGPSSVIYNDDDEIVMEDTSLQELQERRSSRGGGEGKVFSPAPGKKLIVNPVEISHLSGSMQGALRARAVIFDAQAFHQMVNSNNRKVPLELFDDVRFVVRFGPPPSYGPNDGVFSGSVDSDPSVRVQLFVSENSVGGTIETSNRLYRILNGGGKGLHYVVEERRSNR